MYLDYCLKLQHYEIWGKLLKWVLNYQDFLYNRSQKVVVSGEKFPSVSVTSGVPQGTVLGTLLFLIYKMICQIQSHHQLAYLQMILVYRKIKNTLDCTQLQTDLDNLVRWEKVGSMEFNPSKFKVLTVTKKTKPVPDCYKIHGIYLENIVQEKVPWSDTTQKTFLETKCIKCSS